MPVRTLWGMYIKKMCVARQVDKIKDFYVPLNLLRNGIKDSVKLQVHRQNCSIRFKKLIGLRPRGGGLLADISRYDLCRRVCYMNWYIHGYGRINKQNENLKKQTKVKIKQMGSKCKIAEIGHMTKLFKRMTKGQIGSNKQSLLDALQ